jgi:transcriptional regulator with XRE-family HTH domain
MANDNRTAAAQAEMRAWMRGILHERNRARGRGKGKGRRLSQAGLAAVLGIDPSGVSRTINDGTAKDPPWFVTLDFLLAFAKYTEVEIPGRFLAGFGVARLEGLLVSGREILAPPDAEIKLVPAPPWLDGPLHVVRVVGRRRAPLLRRRRPLVLPAARRAARRRPDRLGVRLPALRRPHPAQDAAAWLAVGALAARQPHHDAPDRRRARVGQPRALDGPDAPAGLEVRRRGLTGGPRAPLRLPRLNAAPPPAALRLPRLNAAPARSHAAGASDGRYDAISALTA